MMVNVQAITRQGFDGYWRARRKWFSLGPTTVEVLDQEDDPPDLTSADHVYADPIRIGKASLRELQDDAILVVTAVPANEKARKAAPRSSPPATPAGEIPSTNDTITEE